MYQCLNGAIPLTQGNVPLRHQLNAKHLCMTWQRSAFNEVNDWSPRLVNCLREIRKRTESEDKVHICSENNFPTAAGLASSAAGYACLGKY